LLTDVYIIFLGAFVMSRMRSNCPLLGLKWICSLWSQLRHLAGPGLLKSSLWDVAKHSLQLETVSSWMVQNDMHSTGQGVYFSIMLT